MDDGHGFLSDHLSKLKVPAILETPSERATLEDFRKTATEQPLLLNFRLEPDRPPVGSGPSCSSTPSFSPPPQPRPVLGRSSGAAGAVGGGFATGIYELSPVNPGIAAVRPMASGVLPRMIAPPPDGSVVERVQTLCGHSEAVDCDLQTPLSSADRTTPSECVVDRIQRLRRCTRRVERLGIHERWLDLAAVFVRMRLANTPAEAHDLWFSLLQDGDGSDGPAAKGIPDVPEVSSWAGSGRYRKDAQNPLFSNNFLLALLVVVCCE